MYTHKNMYTNMHALVMYGVNTCIHRFSHTHAHRYENVEEIRFERKKNEVTSQSFDLKIKMTDGKAQVCLHLCLECGYMCSLYVRRIRIQHSCACIYAYMNMYVYARIDESSLTHRIKT